MSQPSEGRNSIALAEEFLQYVKRNPDLRFWQALLSWSELPFIVCMKSKDTPGIFEDTFYWEGKKGRKP